MKSNRKHWDQIFQETADEKMGWYESDPAQTVQLLDQIPNWKTATVFLPGAGTSVLIDLLLAAGTTLILNDISQHALDRVKARLGGSAAVLEWICQNMARPLEKSVPPVDIWIDRAVLHFLTDDADIEGYFKNVSSRVKIGGHVLFAEFAPHGSPKCAGLNLHRYAAEEFAVRLGAGFQQIDHFDYTYVNPNGDLRLYIYILFKRIA